MFADAFHLRHPALLALLLASLLASPALAQDLLIRRITILSPERDAALDNADVLIHEGRIVKIDGSRIDADSVQEIDGAGRFLIPGLIDGHVHLGSDAGLRDDQVADHASLLQAFLRQEPRSYLYFGFTHVVDLNRDEAFAQAWRRHADAPGLTYCKALPFPNGYGEAFLPLAQRNRSPYLLDDPEQRDVMPQGYRPEQHSVSAVIDKVRETEAACVKTFYEEGFAGLWNWPVPSNELVASVGKAAHARGLVHVHHANSLHGYQQAAASKPDVIAHGLWHWDELNREDGLPATMTALLDQLIAQHQSIQATSQVLEGEVRLFQSDFLDDPRLAHAVPSKLLDWYRSEDAQWFRRKLENSLKRTDLVTGFLGRAPSGEPTETSQVGLTRLSRVVDYLNRRGGRLIMGSDTPSSPTYTNQPGLNGLFELRWLARSGIGLNKLLRLATLDTATAFGLQGEIGSIEVGKRADLLILKRDPRQTIDAYDAIEWVVLNGRAIQRDRLSAKRADLWP